MKTQIKHQIQEAEQECGSVAFIISFIVCVERLGEMLMKKILIYVNNIDSLPWIVSYFEDDVRIKYIVVIDEEQLDILKKMDSSAQYVFLSLEEAKCIQIDYQLNFSDKEMRGEIFGLNRYKEFFWKYSPERYNLYMQYMRCDKQDMVGLILGMSYIQRGTNLKRFVYPTCSLAAPTQDLFCDFGMCRYAIEKTGLTNLRYCIIEVNPYRLWYDLSLSINKKRMIYYLPQLENMHHFKGSIYVKNYTRMKKIYQDIFKKDIIYDDFESIRKKENMFREHDTNVLGTCSEEESKGFADEIVTVFHKPYEDTFRENVIILNDMIAYLTTRKVCPLIVLPPFPQVFLENMDWDMYDRTKEVLWDLQRRHASLKILDYTKNDLFDDYYFSDWSHLNYWGANLLTDLLNNELMALAECL